MIRHRLVWIGLLLAVAVGCTSIPKQELSQYRRAFGEVQSSSEAILIDYGDAIQWGIKFREQNAAAASGRSSPQPFSSELKDQPSGITNAIEIRREALRTIDKFNNVLVTLAEGKSVEAIEGAADGFVQAAGSFIASAAGGAIPGLEAVSDAVQTLVGHFEKARLRKEFEKAVRDGAPIIDKMLVALSADRADHYELRVLEANLRQLEIVDDLTESAVSARDIIGAHLAPAGPSPLPDLQKALDKALEPLGKSPELAFSTTAPTGFEANAKSLVEHNIARANASAKAFQANLRQIQKLEETLAAYGEMILETRRAMNSLKDALDQPVVFEEASEKLFAIAFELKSSFEAFKVARATAK